MTKRDVVKKAMLGQEAPPYVPWHFTFTQLAAEKLLNHYGTPEAMDSGMENHFLVLGHDLGFHTDLGTGHTAAGSGCDETVD